MIHTNASTSTQRLAIAGRRLPFKNPRAGTIPRRSSITARQVTTIGIQVQFQCQSACHLSRRVLVASLTDFLANPPNLEPISGLAAPDANTTTTMLACSTSTNNTALAQHRDALYAVWQDIVQSLKRKWKWIVEAFIVSTRSIEVAARFSPLMALTPAAVVSSQVFGSSFLADVTWWYTLKTLQALGPAWQKLGQWAATRRDLFPTHVCDRLSTLHDRGFSHSWRYTHAILCESFGNDFLEKGLVVKELIGCGSAAQVYRGSLQDPNDSSGAVRQVAIKVLHPRFASLVERDLVLLRSLANLLHSFPFETIHVLNLPRVSENFTDILRAQADLRLEGRNLTLFRKNFYGPDGMGEATSQVIFPQPVSEWCARDILVEDLVEDARPIAEFIQDSSEEGWKIRKELAGPLLRSFLKMVFIDSWVHCDLHPGNVMVKTTVLGNGKLKRSIVFLDAGIATALSPLDQQNLVDLFRAVLLDNGYEAGRLMVLRAKHERCSQVEGGIDAFASGVAELVSEFHDRRKNGLTLGHVHIGSLLHRVLDLCRVHGVEIDPSMASIVLSTLVLEGLGRSLHPDLNLLDFAIPFVMGGGRV